MATMKKQAAGSGNAKSRLTSKSEVYAYIADQSGLSRKQVGSVFDALSELIRRDIRKKGPGAFAVPGLLKIKVIDKPAVKARKGINPFTKEETVFKAKPARRVLKIQPLKALKEMA